MICKTAKGSLKGMVLKSLEELKFPCKIKSVALKLKSAKFQAERCV